jgi:hypothetical protein
MAFSRNKSSNLGAVSEETAPKEKVLFKSIIYQE